MVKVLWLCNVVLPDFSQEFAISRINTGGWMTGMLHTLEAQDKTDISLCFPIYDKERLNSGMCNGHKYYTFLCDSLETYHTEMIKAFEHILEESSPDIVHIWGTEFPHTTAMLLACMRSGIIERTIIHIQGLISNYAKHYFADIPEEYLILKNDGKPSLKELKIMRENRGKCEIESIKIAKNVMGRTDWDKACVEAVNPQIHYYFCEEVLRDVFYKNAGTWDYKTCQKHSIFISQATYPIKGFHYLLQALPVVIKKYPDVHVYVAGTDILNKERKDSYAVYIEDLIKIYEINETITFIGSLNEGQMLQQYLKANVFVLASVVENSPNSLNEAMLMGVPCIASFVGGIGNRIRAGVDGFLYPHDEPDLLAYYICKVFENEDGLCERFSDNAVKKMLSLVDPQRNADRILYIYEKLLRQDVKKQ